MSNPGGSNTALAEWPASEFPSVMTVWTQLRQAAQVVTVDEPCLAPLVAHTVLEREDFASSLAALMATKADSAEVPRAELAELLTHVVRADPEVAEGAAIDLLSSVDRNPAYPDPLVPFLFAKGFVGLQLHRAAHSLWREGRQTLAFYLQSQVSERLGIDIHPAARIGRGVFIDHATGVVIGETAVVGDDTSILQGVTLGGTGKDSGDRHPKVGKGVLLSAGANVLGNVVIGDYSKVGAGSVVLHEVPPHTTVVGVPARVVRERQTGIPGVTMDQSCDFPEH
ncbi:MAG: serine O-acetyltransferase [Actinomycetales bacterium]